MFYTLAKALGYHTHDNHLTNDVFRELSTKKKGIFNITYKVSIMGNSLLFCAADN